VCVIASPISEIIDKLNVNAFAVYSIKNQSAFVLPMWSQKLSRHTIVLQTDLASKAWYWIMSKHTDAALYNRFTNATKLTPVNVVT